MGTLKDRLTDDLRTAMKAREEVTTATLRMALASVRNAEVAGKAAQELSDSRPAVAGGRRRRKASDATSVSRTT